MQQVVLWYFTPNVVGQQLSLKARDKKKKVGTEGQNDSTISSLLKPLEWIDWLMDVQGKVGGSLKDTLSSSN